MEDHHVDRPDVEAQQCVKLTGTNRSNELDPYQKAEDRDQGSDPHPVQSFVLPPSCSAKSPMANQNETTPDIPDQRPVARRH